MEKTFSSLIFCKHGAVDDFHGAIVISFQIREIRGGGGAEFPVIRGLEKSKLSHTRICTSTSTRHVT